MLLFRICMCPSDSGKMQPGLLANAWQPTWMSALPAAVWLQSGCTHVIFSDLYNPYTYDVLEG